MLSRNEPLDLYGMRRLSAGLPHPVPGTRPEYSRPDDRPSVHTMHSLPNRLFTQRR